MLDGTSLAPLSSMLFSVCIQTSGTIRTDFMRLIKKGNWISSSTTVDSGEWAVDAGGGEWATDGRRQPHFRFPPSRVLARLCSESPSASQPLHRRQPSPASLRLLQLPWVSQDQRVFSARTRSNAPGVRCSVRSSAHWNDGKQPPFSLHSHQRRKLSLTGHERSSVAGRNKPGG